MFRTELNRMSEVWNEIKAHDAVLAAGIAGIEEKVRQCERTGFERLGKELKKMADALVEERRLLYELMIALNVILRIYEKKEEALLDNINGIRKKEVREAGWISVSFPKEIMKIIKRIKIREER